MSTVTVNLPDGVTPAEAQLYLAIKLWEAGRLSCGQAAAVASLTKRTFLELAAREGVVMFDQTAEEFADDMRHV